MTRTHDRTTEARRHLALALIPAALAVLLVAASTIAATGPKMVKQLVAGPGGLQGEGIMGVLGSRVLFAADAVDGHGQQLWKTDGTGAGTSVVKDIDPTTGSSIDYGNVTRLGSRIYFSANDGTHGDELWYSDGTPGGTQMLKDIDPDPDGMTGAFTAAGGQVFFLASDGAANHGYELWKTDGTPGGTKMVKDIGPGTTDGGIGKVTKFGSKVLFCANDGVHGLELWISDGTKNGTHQVKDINDGGAHDGFIGYPGGGPVHAVANGVMYFEANDGMLAGDHGSELWRSDGTAAGTHIVKDINPGLGGTALDWIRPLGTRILFSTSDGTNYRIWVSDGTAGGTHALMDSVHGVFPTSPYPLGSLGSVYYFSARDAAHGLELWRTDGTNGGTRMVRDMWKGPNGSFPYDAAALGGKLYLAAENGKGEELWRSDGTKAGTTLVMDINPGPSGSTPFALTAAAGRLFFFADDGTHGTELWTYVP